MRCPQCQKEVCKYGKGKKGSQRYHCAKCNKTFTFGEVPKDKGEPVPDTPKSPIAAPGPYTAPPEDGAGPMLQAYRHVIYNDASHDTTPLQKQARQFMESNLERFHMAINRMERDMQEASQARGAGLAVRDLGLERCEELIERLLDEFEAEEVSLGYK